VESRIEGPGSTIGPYRLIERLGEGGFGVVFLAEQLEPIRRRVALKVIKPGMDSYQVVGALRGRAPGAGADGAREHRARSRRRQTETGRPYFVMELVRGLASPRTATGATLRPERLELFATSAMPCSTRIRRA
jgi:serine/threonine protein kinase